MRDGNMAVLWAVLAAALYAVSAPLSKLLMAGAQPTMLAAFLYLGAGGGMLLFGLVRRKAGMGANEKPLSRGDWKYALGMIALDIAAPVLLMLGISRTSAANVSLLNNFEIVSTALTARILFRERVDRRLWLAISLITLASLLLSFESAESLRFSEGSLYVLLACVCWGFENNCTRMMSAADPLRIVVLKGLGSGAGALLLALIAGESLPGALLIAKILLLGFFAYGLSIYFYVYAQRKLGAARTSAWYAISPFIGAALSFLIYREPPTALFLVALAVMLAGAYFAAARDEQSRWR